MSSGPRPPDAREVPTPSALQASAEAFEAAADGIDDPGLPPTSFLHLVLSLHEGALAHLGDAPQSGAELDLHLARQTIDLLAVLVEKTQGNLTGDEERLLTQALHDCRLRFVEVARTR